MQLQEELNATSLFYRGGYTTQNGNGEADMEVEVVEPQHYSTPSFIRPGKINF
jgi:hypothetical protein